MPDDLTKNPKQDDLRVNVNQEQEVLYWSRTLMITPAKLKEVVAKVGPMVADIQRAIARVRRRI